MCYSNSLACVSEFSEEVEGDLFVVERYESDVEEERASSLSLGDTDGRSHVMIRLCDGSLEEIDDATGKASFQFLQTIQIMIEDIQNKQRLLIKEIAISNTI